MGLIAIVLHLGLKKNCAAFLWLKNVSLVFQIAPEVRCFRYVFGVKIPPHQVFGSLGYSKTALELGLWLKKTRFCYGFDTIGGFFVTLPGK